MKAGLNVSRIVLCYLLCYFSGAIASRSADPVLKATISVSDGSRIYDDQVAGWIRNIIGQNAKQLIILTECYGGNAVDNFAGAANTAVASATSPGEQAEYGAYDSAAAGALRPGAGRTAQNVQNAGKANKAKDGTENPSSGGGLSLGDFPLDATSADGNVQSRHIIVYAGKPSAKGYDANLRDKIKNNFAGQQNTTVTTAGGAGTSQGWDNPGTAKGLRDAIIATGITILNAPDPSKEQFILFITDHGDLHSVTNVNATVPDGGCLTVTDFPTFRSADLNPGNLVTPGFSVFIPLSGNLAFSAANGAQVLFQPGQWIFSLAPDAQFTNALVLTNFTELNSEFTNNIVPGQADAGVTLFFPVDLSLFTNSFFDTTTNLKLYNFSGAEYTVATLSQDSGDVPKGTSNLAAYTALAGDFDGDGKADPAKYLETNGTWQVMLSGNGYAATRFTLGGTGYSPVAGDFDGDGKADPASYEESTGAWQAMLSGNGYGTINFSLGGDPDRPVAADFDGDRKADPAAYNMSTGDWLIRLSASGYATVSASLVTDGDSFPVAGDFDGDGKADLAVYQRATGAWFIKLSASGYATTVSLVTDGDSFPVAGDFDGDGKADPAVMNPAGNWFVWFSSQSYTRSGPFNFTVQNEPVLVSATSNDRFDPAAITASPGQVVQWHNADVDPHTVTADSANVVAGGPDSDSTFPNGIPADGTYSWTVPANAVPGTAWYYHCRFHGAAGDGHGPGTGMAGTIMVP